MIGHGSDIASTSVELYQQRADNLSSEGFVSGGDSLERDRPAGGGARTAVNRDSGGEALPIATGGVRACRWHKCRLQIVYV